MIGLGKKPVKPRVQEILARHELDALLATSPENLQYLSGVEFFHLEVASGLGHRVTLEAATA